MNKNNYQKNMLSQVMTLVVLLLSSLSLAQPVRCNFEKCDVGCDPFFGTGCSTTCYYVCDDGVERRSSHAHMKYGCREVSGMWNNKPDCAKEKRAVENFKAQMAKGRENLKKQDGEKCDNDQAREMAICLSVIGQHYVDLVNEYLVNGQNAPLLNKIDFNSGRDSINAYNGCFDKFSYKDLAKGKGLEMSLAEDRFGGCVYGYDYSSCKKGMKILLKTSFKKGLQDKIVDECDFWNDCEKVDGSVIDAVLWEIPGKTNCDIVLKEKMKEKTLDIRKKLK